MKRQTKLQQTFVQAGADAFAAALTVNDCPYQESNIAYGWWLHGWWSAYYKGRDAKISGGEACSECAAALDHVTTGIYIVGKHGTTKTVCGICKEDMVHYRDYQVMAQARFIDEQETGHAER